MQVVETNTDSLPKDFKVTVAASDIETRIDSRLIEVGQDARIPGFRPGKVPVNVLRQRFGPAVRGEVLEAADGVIDARGRQLRFVKGISGAHRADEVAELLELLGSNGFPTG